MKSLILAAVLLLSPFMQRAQSPLVIPYQNQAITMDGIAGAGEWAGAVVVKIGKSATDSVTVRLVHDCDNLYALYEGRLESGNVFPELMLDPNLDQSVAWMPDDWWFHVSATDCESQGMPNDYSNCQAVQPDWEGVPNFTAPPPPTDTVEVRIPFQKAGLAVGDSFGLALDVTNTFSAWHLWPVGADLQNPSTWSVAVIDACVPVGVQDLPGKAGELSVFPNPLTAQSMLRFYADKAGEAQLQLINLTGQVVISEAISVNNPGWVEHSWNDLTATGKWPSTGVYFLRIGLENQEWSSRVVLR